MYWHKIAAAAAAAAAFRRSGCLPASWRQRFPDARLKIHRRFNVVRILWTLLVIFHGRVWRFATQIIEMFFLAAQWLTVIHNPRFFKKIYKTFRHIQWWYSALENDSHNFSLMTTVDRFVNDCTHVKFLHSFLLHRSSLEIRVQLLHLGLMISTLEIALANVLRDVLVLMSTSDIVLENFLGNVLVLANVADVHQPSKMDFPHLLFLCAFFMTSFHSFSILHLDSTLLGMKDILFVLLGFSKHASLRGSSPESSGPYVTLDSRSSLIWTTFGVHIPFFPNSHLRVFRTPWTCTVS